VRVELVLGAGFEGELLEIPGLIRALRESGGNVAVILLVPGLTRSEGHIPVRGDVEDAVNEECVAVVVAGLLLDDGGEDGDQGLIEVIALCEVEGADDPVQTT